MSRKQGHGTLLGNTTAYCVRCGGPEIAPMVGRPDGVYMERQCPRDGRQSIRVASKREWYQRRTEAIPVAVSGARRRRSRRGCPLDCGLCEWHAGKLRLPIFSITNQCNLRCPKCFTYNRDDRKYHKTVGDTRRILRSIVRENPGVQILNLTGGEPTLHPRLTSLLRACRHPSIRRITMNTNGLRLARDPRLAATLKRMGIQVVLSLDTLDPRRSVRIHGRDITREKRMALRMLEDHDIPTTLLNVCIPGVNEDDTARITRDFLKKDFVRSVTIQNMTYTGLNGSRFQPRRHITLDEVETVLEKTGEFSRRDFFPLHGYHPLCYSVAYYLQLDGRRVPFTQVLSSEALQAFSRDHYMLQPDSRLSGYISESINRLWAETRDEVLIRGLKAAMMELMDGKRSEAAERMVKAIYIHSHMDEDNFDLHRVSLCGDLVPDEQGRMIPACAYNLIYRKQDPRFWVEQGSGASRSRSARRRRRS